MRLCPAGAWAFCVWPMPLASATIVKLTRPFPVREEIIGMITCALLGYGWWGRTIAGRIAGSDQIKIRAVVDPAEAARRDAGAAGFAVCAELNDALKNPTIDAVIVA